MMKKMNSLAFLMMVAVAVFSQHQSAAQANTGIYFGLTYAKPVRAEFDKYMSVISDSLKLNNPLLPKNSYGIQGGIVFRSKKSEFEAGGSYIFGLAIKSKNATNGTEASLSTNTFDLHFGYNQLVAGPLLLGIDMGVISNNGKLMVTGTSAANSFESTPESHNPFKGYIFYTRPKGGFSFPLKKGQGSAFRLLAYYDLGLSKYDFYNKDIFDKRLKNYKGATKSGYTCFGVQASLVLALQ